VGGGCGAGGAVGCASPLRHCCWASLAVDGAERSGAKNRKWPFRDRVSRVHDSTQSGRDVETGFDPRRARAAGARLDNGARPDAPPGARAALDASRGFWPAHRRCRHRWRDIWHQAAPSGGEQPQVPGGHARRYQVLGQRRRRAGGRCHARRWKSRRWRRPASLGLVLHDGGHGHRPRRRVEGLVRRVRGDPRGRRAARRRE